MGTIDWAENVELKLTTDEDWENYYAAFGRLMFAFATAEEEINRTLGDYIAFRLLHLQGGKLREQEVVRALIAGMRITATRDTLKRLLRVTEAPDEVQEEVTEIMAHLADLTALRDQLAHHASYPMMLADGTFQTTNQISAREMMRIEWVSFHPNILLAAAADLEQIPYRLRLAMEPNEKKRLPTVSAEWAEQIDRLSAPWQYKPGELVRKGPKHDKNPQWRSRPPRSSEE